MKTCLKCGKELSPSNEKYYGIIEEYHFDNRRTTDDMDTGAYIYKPVALIKAGICDECLKKIYTKWIFKTVINLAIAALSFSILVSGSDFLDWANGILGSAFFIASLVFAIRGFKVFFKELTLTKKIKHLFNGNVPKEYVIDPAVDQDIDIEEIPPSLDYRHRYKYWFVDEKKLQQPLKEEKHEQDYNAALNKLKKNYQETDKTERAADKNNVVGMM